MTSTSSNPWETEPTKAGLVSIGTHSLYLSASGPPRCTSPSGAPDAVVLFSTGGGMPFVWYVKLQSLLVEKLRRRVYFYDRAGYGESEMYVGAPGEGEEKRTAERAAKELNELLNVADIPGPYVLLGHSYGCQIMSEFLALRDSIDVASGAKQSVAAMVFAEPGTPLFFDFVRYMGPVMKGVEYSKISNLRGECGLTDDEWEAADTASRRTGEKGGSEKEADYAETVRLLDAKRLSETQALGDRRLVVIRAWCDEFRTMYEEGVRLGNGTEEERDAARAFLDRAAELDVQLKKSLLGMSRKSRYVELNDVGHDLPIRRPHIVVEEVKSVFEELEE